MEEEKKEAPSKSDDEANIIDGQMNSFSSKVSEIESDQYSSSFSE